LNNSGGSYSTIFSSNANGPILNIAPCWIDFGWSSSNWHTTAAQTNRWQFNRSPPGGERSPKGITGDFDSWLASAKTPCVR
jgi:hypothetical protein